MKDELDKRSAIQKFDDNLADLINTVEPGVTICEIVGCIELQLHILKNRYTNIYAMIMSKKDKE